MTKSMLAFVLVASISGCATSMAPGRTIAASGQLSGLIGADASDEKFDAPSARDLRFDPLVDDGGNFAARSRH